MRILLLEDDDSDATLTIERLHRIPDWEIDWAETRERFLELLLAKQWDAILIDNKLTSFSGNEALAIVMEKAPHVPCILLTGTLQDEEAAAEVLRRGFVDYLIKDRQARLQQAIEKAVEWKQGQLIKYRAGRMEIVGQFHGSIAHDLNNIMAPLVMGVPLLRHYVPPEAQKILDRMEEAATRGTDLVKHLVVFIKGENEHGEHAPLSIVDSVNAALRWLDSYKRIEVHRAFGSGIPIVRGNKTQLHQVLTNFLVNSRDAMNAVGTIVVTIERRDLETSALIGRDLVTEGGVFASVSIADDGCGMAPETLARMFDPFFTTKTTGTGFGLSTVRQIMREHRGYLDAQSFGVGRGAVFTIYLPAAVKPDDARQLPGMAGNGELILFVDDETLFAELNRFTLETYGYKVVTAANGAEGLSKFADYPDVQLVLTDLVMPVMDGPTFIAELHRRDPDVRIIGLTGRPDLGVNGAVAMLAKPYSNEALLTAVKRALSD